MYAQLGSPVRNTRLKILVASSYMDTFVNMVQYDDDGDNEARSNG